MNARKLILVYGKDVQLLDTRSWVLQRAGFDVHYVQDIPSAALFLREHGSDLLILCHTLSADEQEAATVIAQAARSETKVLVMTTEDSNRTKGGPVIYLNALAGPVDLIDKAKQTLDLSSPA
jgi:DNA-binding response OmpR family regulator